MTFKNYLKSCKQFADETAEWGGVDPRQQYTTVEPYGWEETCDNEHGGLFIEWAFHTPEKFIEENAEGEYLTGIYKRFLVRTVFSSSGKLL